MSQLRQLDDAKFEETVAGAEGLLAVEFGAAWCAPCRIVEPVLAQLEAEFAPHLTVLSLDTDVNPYSASRFGVRGLPTVVFFRDGVEVDRSVGALPKGLLKARVEANLRVGQSAPAASA